VMPVMKAFLTDNIYILLFVTQLILSVVVCISASVNS